MEQARELTYEERATFGECPVCHAPHGERCDGNQGFSFGGPKTGGVHLGRLNNAPRVAVTTYR